MRRLLTTGAALALVLTGLVTGPAAKATSGWCTDTWPTTTAILDNPGTGPYLAFEWYNSFVSGGGAVDDDSFVVVCYSDTPGASPSWATGGAIVVRVGKIAADSYWTRVECHGDSPTWLATVNCNTGAVTTVTTSTSTTPPSAGATTSGYFYANGSTVTVGTTGANTGAVSTTTATNPQLTWSGTCTTVAGITPPGTSCFSTPLDSQVGAGDDPNLGTGGTTGTCLVTVGTTCHLYAPRAFVEAFDDTLNSSFVDVLGTRVFNDPGRVCVGFGC